MGRHLHFDCFSGISGDMVLGALVDAGLPFKELVQALGSLNLDGYKLTKKQVCRGALHATKVDVVIAREVRVPLPSRRIHSLIAGSGLPGPVKDRARAVFEELAHAEGAAHRVSPSRVHFHEVGLIDSIVDVVGSVWGLQALQVERITASPINVGAGTTTSAHGVLPVPGPAVAALGRGMPIYSQGPSRELATPTGMALLRALSEDFGSMPLLRTQHVGYGAGTADFEDWPNVLRVFIGERYPRSADHTDRIVELASNLDDLSPQAYETVMDRLFAAGALDVTLTPMIMKRGRPGVALSVLVPPEQMDAASAVLFRDTTALGLRVQEIQRRTLPRRFVSLSMTGGTVRIKLAEVSRGRTKAAPEYLDCKRIAERTGRPVKDIMEDALVAYRLQERTKRRPAGSANRTRKR
ncbi:MAG TPA: nickel pincer cofactor biosynthesis protein LarC [Nitrospiraceae bacterium]|nr:nickel pincer cofactor biosynthesis protein LarC [Nitrospiraceae bacterium]